MTRAERARWIAVGLLQSLERTIEERTDLAPLDPLLCAEALILAARTLFDQARKAQAAARKAALH